MIKIVDAKGKSCPLPLILTKRSIDESSLGDVIEVLLDNEISKCNLAQYLSEIGLDYSEKIEQGVYCIKFVLGELDIAKGVEGVDCPMPAEQNNIEPYVTVVKSAQMGEGDESIGELLMRSYINSLVEVKSLPKIMIFYNSGVKLLDKDCDCIEALREIESRGVEIISCGVCIEYYAIEPCVGKISNMFKIANTLAEAPKIIYP